MLVAAVIVAAGSGERLAAGVPKALVPLNGRPLFEWATDLFAGHPDVRQVVVAGPVTHLDEIRDVVGGRACVVAGGSSRPASVRAGLAAVDPGTDFVLVHDAARPLVPVAVLAAVIDALRGGAEAVVPAIAVADTIKRVDSDGRVLETVDRAEVRAIQTPQGFRFPELRQAYADAETTGLLSMVTDDAGLYEALGRAVHCVAGDPAGMKITTTYDLIVAEALARAGVSDAGSSAP
jgi:2-C-methyl-D-erythritol 4-phosphate cytidylyltransferase